MDRKPEITAKVILQNIINGRSCWEFLSPSNQSDLDVSCKNICYLYDECCKQVWPNQKVFRLAAELALEEIKQAEEKLKWLQNLN